MFGFSDLEDRLMSDDGPAIAVHTLQQVHQFRSRIAALVDAGLPAADYQDATQLMNAINACEHVLLDTSHLNGAPK